MADETVDAADTTPTTPEPSSSTETVVPQAVQEKFDAIQGDGAPEQDGQNLREDDAPEEAAPEGGEVPVDPNADPDAALATELASMDPMLKLTAKRLGWTNEQLTDTYKALGKEGCERQLQFFQRSLVDVSRQFAGFNPQQQQQPQRQQQRQAPQQEEEPQQSEQQTLLDRAFGKNLPKLRDKYGNDFFDEVMVPLQEQILKPAFEMSERYRHDLAARERETQVREFTGTVERLEKDMPDFYGKGATKNAEQQTRYNQLLQVADRIRTGSEYQGIPCSIEDALEQSHILIAAERIAENERKKITQSVQRRSNGFTTRPTQRRAPVSASEGANPLQAATKAIAEKFARMNTGE
jgi:hypothetical protein